MAVTPPWLDELDLEPDGEPVSMGIRALGDRPWLLVDDRRDDELALKAELCRVRHHEVFAASDEAAPASEETCRLLVEAGIHLVDDDGLHPLDRAGRSVQEDLCLMHRRSDGWYLAAASLCFPSRWRLHDKLDRHVTEVHGPVDGYERRLARRVDTFFDRLTTSPVWRRNWFVHPDPALFQPDRPTGGDPIIGAAAALETLVVRSERQTLRRLDPHTGWILFTIRVQQATLAQLVTTPDRSARFRRLLAGAPAEHLTHRGMRPEQVLEIQSALRRHRTHPDPT